jgi:hypothetical protein
LRNAKRGSNPRLVDFGIPKAGCISGRGGEHLDRERVERAPDVVRGIPQALSELR